MWLQIWLNLDPTHPFSSAVAAIWPNLAASAILAIGAYFLVIKRMIICNHKWCFRIGHHKVKGTHFRTCTKHTTQHYHEYLQAVHKRKYPEQHEFLKKARRGLD